MDSGWLGSELIGNSTVLCFKKIPAVSTFVISLPRRSPMFYVNEQILESHKNPVSFNTLFSNQPPQKHGSHPCRNGRHGLTSGREFAYRCGLKRSMLASNQFTWTLTGIKDSNLNIFYDKNSTQIGLAKKEMYSLLLQRSPEVSCFRYAWI